MSKKNRLILILTAILIALIIALLIWASFSNHPMEEAIQTILDSEGVEVDTKNWLTFSPDDKDPKKGFIIYPGGKVEPESYAPLGKEIARGGVKVVIVPMPLNLAVFGSNEALQVVTKYDSIDTWVIGGHSLGGAMAAGLVHKYPDNFDGLVLWASYPGGSNDLSDYNIDVLSIYAEHDGLATVKKIDNSRKLLPANTRWIEIEGGNHSQFGWYGFQQDDNEAEISRDKQQQIIIEETVEFLRSLSDS